MPPSSPTAVASARRGSSDRGRRKRRELAESALATLAEFGYAHTSLRMIAQHSPYSHGVVHYYFPDKAALMSECIDLWADTLASNYPPEPPHHTRESLVARCKELWLKRVTERANFCRVYYDLRVAANYDEEAQRLSGPMVEAVQNRLRLSLEYFEKIFDQSCAWGLDTAVVACEGVIFEALRRASTHGPGAAKRYIDDSVDALVGAFFPDNGADGAA